MTMPAREVPAEDQRRLVAEAIEGLAAWAVEAVRQPLPNEVLQKAAMVLVDDLAAICAAHDEPEIAALHAKAAAAGEPPEATILAPGAPRAGRHTAAIANGVAGCWCELDEGYRGAPCHAGLYLLPALASEAEAGDASLRQVLAMLAVAYEVNARIAEAWTFPAMSVHPHAAFANFGAAAGAALARGASADTLAAAIRIAGGLVPAGTYQAAVEGALVRNLWSGHAASTGMRAVDWAECGLDGYADGPLPAFAHLLGARTEPGKLQDGLGRRWAILGCYHKLHGCCHSTHAAVEAAIEAHRLLAARPASRIRHIRLLTHRPGMSNKTPGNTLAARFSFEHVVAAALTLGQAGPAAFTREAIANPEIAALRHLVHLSAYQPLPAWPLDRPARLDIELDAGDSITTECMSAPGGPDRPLTPERLLEKATDLTGTAFPAFPPLAAAILKLDADTLDRPWRDALPALLGAA